MTAFSYPERGVYEHFEIQGKAYQSQRQEPCVPLLCGYAPGSMKELVRVAKGHVWICRLRDEVQAREIEKKYHISSKQLSEDGVQIRLISEKMLNMGKINNTVSGN